MTKPEALCRAALIAVGMPSSEVDKLKVGRLMDVYVHVVVMNNIPYEIAKGFIERNFDSNGNRLKEFN